MVPKEMVRTIKLSDRDEKGKTPLFYAKTSEAIEALVKLGADLQATDNEGTRVGSIDDTVFLIEPSKDYYVMSSRFLDCSMFFKPGQFQVQVDRSCDREVNPLDGNLRDTFWFYGYLYMVLSST